MYLVNGYVLNKYSFKPPYVRSKTKIYGNIFLYLIDKKGGDRERKILLSDVGKLV